MAENTAKRIDITEFRERGYLQEANRLFFHPLGLALEVVREEDGSERLGGVRDSRDDPEGILFAEYDEEKALEIREMLLMRAGAREALGCCDILGVQRERRN